MKSLAAIERCAMCVRLHALGSGALLPVELDELVARKLAAREGGACRLTPKGEGLARVRR